MYKLVDHFNGWESRERYGSWDEAEEAVIKYRKVFYHNHTENTGFCVGIVHENADWIWNEHTRSWMWINIYG